MSVEILEDIRRTCSNLQNQSAQQVVLEAACCECCAASAVARNSTRGKCISPLPTPSFDHCLCFSCRTCPILCYPPKNGERSLTVPFTREDTTSSTPDDKDKSQDPEKATSNKEEMGLEGVLENGAPKKPSKSKLTQDFRTEKGFAGFAAAAQRGDLVTFDVVLNRG